MNKKKFDYKWVILVLCFLMVFCALGFCSGSKSLYLNKITRYLGIERSLFSINDSIRYVTTAIISVFFGAIYGKLGARKMIALGFTCLVASCLIYAFAPSIGVFYIGGFLLGAGLAVCSSSLAGYVVSRWFTTNVGTYSGIVLAANGLGTATITQFIEPMIEGSADGYKKAYLFTAILIAVVGVIIVVFIREKPKGAVDDGSGPKRHKRPKRSKAWVGLSLKEAVKKPYFYGMLVCMFLTGASLQAIAGIAVPHIKDVVCAKDAAGNLLAFDTGFIRVVHSAHAICLASAKFVSGFSYDHLGIRRTATISYLIATGSMFILGLVQPGSYVLAFIYEVIVSFAMPLETVIPLLMVSDLFGEKDYAKILGINSAVIYLGFAVGTPVINLVFDKVGTYRPALFVVSGLMAVIMILTQFICRTGEKVKRDVIAREAEKETAAAGV